MAYGELQLKPHNCLAAFTREAGIYIPSQGFDLFLPEEPVMISSEVGFLQENAELIQGPP